MAVVCNIKMNHCVPVYKVTLRSFVVFWGGGEKEEKFVQRRKKMFIYIYILKHTR